MKKITLLMIALITLTVFGQEKLTHSTEEYFDGADWIEHSRLFYTYDGNNNLIETNNSYWNSNESQWVVNSKDTYTYNVNNQVLIETYESLGEDNYGYRTSYDYDASGNVIQQIEQNLEGLTWVNSSKVDINYSDGVLTSGDQKEWDGANWVVGEDSGFFTFIYTGTTVSYLMIEEDWDGTNWNSMSRNLFTHDANDNMLSQVFQVWSNDIWIDEGFKQEYAYDANNNRINSKELYYENGEWFLELETTSNFDTTQLMSNYIHPFVLSDLDILIGGDPYVNKVLNKYVDSENSGRLVHHYSDDLVEEVAPMLTHSSNQYYDVDNSIWLDVEGSKTVYLYDENDNLIEENSVTWDDSVWESNWKSVFTYNSINKVETETSSSNGITSSELAYTYNSNRKITQQLINYWDDENDVLMKSKIDFLYTNTIFTSATESTWDGLDWIPSGLITPTYAANGTVTYVLNQSDWNGSAWEEQDRTAHTYNATNKVLSNEEEIWDGANWVSAGYKEEFAYDTNGNRISSMDFSYENGELLLEYSETFNFDATELMSNYINPFKLSDIDILLGIAPHVNKLLSSVDVENNWKTIYHYDDDVASVNEKVNLIGVSVYPNPTTDFITIDESDFAIENVEVFNILGKKVKTTNKSRFSVNEFSNGVYILRINTTDGKIVTTKIIKK
tara:strand:+ start:11384 stop:13402 length:2019 start_codon:yes stop_codon:yes gene_type:complete